MADIEKVMNGLEHCLSRYVDGLCDDCPYMGAIDKTYMIPMKCKEIIMRDALELLKEQEKLVNVDKLREKLGFAESCEKCKKDSWRCQRDTYFSEMDFCDRFDYAIEELIKEGR